MNKISKRLWSGDSELKLDKSMPTFEKPTIEKRLEVETLENIENIRIREVALALFRLAQEVIEGRQNYDFIISDDASGRLPSLFLKKILDGFRRAQGLPDVNIRFIATGRHGKEAIFKSIKDYLEKNVRGRVLIVTEFIDTGGSITRLAQILESVGLKFDIASVTISTKRVLDEVLGRFQRKSASSRIFSGGTSSLGAILHGASSMSGVKKGEISSPFPEKYASPDTLETHRLKIQKTVNQARKDIDLLAQETLKILLPETSKKEVKRQLK